MFKSSIKKTPGTLHSAARNTAVQRGCSQQENVKVVGGVGFAFRSEKHRSATRMFTARECQS